jgi:hypothetical protein
LAFTFNVEPEGAFPAVEQPQRDAVARRRPQTKPRATAGPARGKRNGPRKRPVETVLIEKLD